MPTIRTLGLFITAFASGTDKGITDPTLLIRPHDLIPTGDASGDFPCGVIRQAGEDLAGGAGFGTQAHDLVGGQTAIADVANGQRGGG